MTFLPLSVTLEVFTHGSADTAGHKNSLKCGIQSGVPQTKDCQADGLQMLQQTFDTLHQVPVLWNMGLTETEGSAQMAR